MTLHDAMWKLDDSRPWNTIYHENLGNLQPSYVIFLKKIDHCCVAIFLFLFL